MTIFALILAAALIAAIFVIRDLARQLHGWDPIYLHTGSSMSSLHLHELATEVERLRGHPDPVKGARGLINEMRVRDREKRRDVRKQAAARIAKASAQAGYRVQAFEHEPWGGRGFRSERQIN